MKISLEEPMAKIYCYCDGACSNNGKEIATAGIAFWLKPEGYTQNKQLRVIKIIRKDIWKVTSQRAELICVIEALKSFHKFGVVVEVVTDSRYVTETMKGLMKRKTNMDLWIALDNLSKLHQVTWTWMQRCSIPELAWCDKFASDAARETITDSSEVLETA
jgi:ribonuclease HI